MTTPQPAALPELPDADDFIGKLLTKAQAFATYSAMNCLTNAGDRIAVTIGETVRVMEMPSGAVHIRQKLGGEWDSGELYGCRGAFASAYGLSKENTCKAI